VPHVFVETNWLFAYAAPAHHQVPTAAELLERAQRGEFALHLPNICLGEARQAIRTKCQPRAEANAIRRFLSWATPAGKVIPEDAGITRAVLDKYERSIQDDLNQLDDNLKVLAALPYINIFGLDDTMLDRATALALAGIAPKPFDHAILAGILVTAQRLWESGERGLSFCETDAGLQPWGRYGDIKPELRAAYDQSHVWVYGDFTLAQPMRPSDFE
jgi:predicted nucleic acid-binding protein